MPLFLPIYCFVVSPTKHGRHIGIVSVVGVVVVIRVVTLLVSDQLLLKECINFIKTVKKDKASLNTGQVLKRG